MIISMRELRKWLATARDEEIREKKAITLSCLESATDSYIRADLKRIIREMEEELAARAIFR